MNDQGVSGVIDLLDAERVFAAGLRVAEAMGQPKRRALRSANALAHRFTGIDLAQEIAAIDTAQRPTTARPSAWRGADAVLDYLEGRDEVTVADVERDVFPSRGAGQRTQIGKLLRSLGWTGRRHRIDGGWSATWTRPSSPPRPPVMTVRFNRGTAANSQQGGRGA